jgi:hypothetical protein
MTDDNKVVVDLGEARGEKFLDDLQAGKYPALSAGYGPIEKHIDWYLANGYCHGDMLAAFAYSAAAQCFRDYEADAAETLVTDTFVQIVSELLRYGPKYGHEAYGGKPTADQMKAIFAKLRAAVDRYENMTKAVMDAMRKGELDLGSDDDSHD